MTLLTRAVWTLALPMLAADPATVPIGSPKLRAVIVPDKGGEMASLAVLHQGRWVETLYRALDYSDKPGWTGKAPFLWPATGRNGDLMPIHGFARDMPWKLESKGPDRATVSLVDTRATRKPYPHGFRIVADYRVRANTATIAYAVTADKSNTGPMSFAAGNHITFKTPLVDGTDPLKMEFETPSSIEYTKTTGGIPTGDQRPRTFAKGTELGSFPAMAAISLAGYSGDPRMLLRDPGGIAIRMSQSTDRVPPEPVVRFNVWGDPKNGYFSPEPWVGLQGSFLSRKGMVALDPGATWKWRIEIAVEAQP
jgi:galactose mutarotase-like enzyme